MEKKLNLGAGYWKKEGWTNYDKLDRDGTDVIMNFEQDYSLPLGGVTKIYISHVLEHLQTVDVKRLLRKCRDALTDGGIIRILCPDYDLFKRMYLEGARKTFYFNEAILNQIALEGDSVAARFCCSICRYQDGDYTGPPPIPQARIADRIKSDQRFINWVVSQAPSGVAFDHRNAFNEDILRKLLKEAGFKGARIGRAGPEISSDDEMCGPEFSNRPDISLVIEAIK